MASEREHLAELSDMLREGLEEITGTPNPSRSAIVPLMIGDASRAVEVSRRLEQEGVLALPIRRPTVPEGGERIRFSLHAGLSFGDVAKILNSIKNAMI